VTVQFLKSLALGTLAYMILDAIWLGVLMKNTYRDQLAPIARMADGGLAPNWTAAVCVYLLLGAGVALLSAPRAHGLGSAALHGAAFGLVVYGVYDLTNFATLRQWPLAITLIDIGWGIAAGACATMVVQAFK
jgi:uncharacterized membrane protein